MKFSHVLGLFSLTFALLGQSWAAEVGVTPTAETRFLKTAIALQGQNLSQDVLQQKATAAFQTYDQTAPIEDRENRMVGALVSMGVMTPERVTALQTLVGTTLNGTQAGTDTQIALTQAVQATLAHANEGAEFSSCGSHLEWAAGFAAGAVGLFVTAHYLGVDRTNEGDNQLFYGAVGELASAVGGCAFVITAVVEVLTSGC